MPKESQATPTGAVLALVGIQTWDGGEKITGFFLSSVTTDRRPPNDLVPQMFRMFREERILENKIILSPIPQE